MKKDFKKKKKKKSARLCVCIIPSSFLPVFPSKKTLSLTYNLASSSFRAPTRFSNSATTSRGLVTCHLASVRLDGCPTAVVNMSSGVSCSSTRVSACPFSTGISETDSGGSIVYGRVVSGNCNARNMSSSVCSYCKDKH